MSVTTLLGWQDWEQPKCPTPRDGRINTTEPTLGTMMQPVTIMAQHLIC